MGFTRAEVLKFEINGWLMSSGWVKHCKYGFIQVPHTAIACVKLDAHQGHSNTIVSLTPTKLNIFSRSGVDLS